MKLHLGCGTVYLDGWINIDADGDLVNNASANDLRHNITTVDKYFKHEYGNINDIGNRPGGNKVIVDKKMQLQDLHKTFEVGSIDEILMVSVLEHLNKSDAYDLLIECNLILKIGGICKMSVPDIPNTVLAYLLSDTPEMHEYGMSLIYGSQKNMYSFHLWGYTAEMLCNLCKATGFRNASQIIPNPIKHVYPMLMIGAIK